MMANSRNDGSKRARDESEDDINEVTVRLERHLKVMRHEAIFRDGVLPARIKALAAALWSVSARCEPCIEGYMRQAREFGATPAETGEMLAIASAMGGCVGETWANKALSVMTEERQTDDCCED